MIMINPCLPVYKNNNSFRLGNLPRTGKILNNCSDEVIALLDLVICKNSIEDIYYKMGAKYNISKKEVDESIEVLLKNGILVTDEILENCKDHEEYDRETLFFSLFTGFSSQEKGLLEKAHITILGLGAVGCRVLESLARCGVRHFHIIDYDNVDFSNLQRQSMYSIEDIGKKKIDAAEERLKIVVGKSIEIEKTFLDVMKIARFHDNTIVISTVDYPRMEIRDYINRIAYKDKVPVIFGGFTEYMGIAGPFIVPGKTACWECIENQISTKDMLLKQEEVVPSYSPLCEMISSIITNEIIKYITLYEKPFLVGKSLMVNILNYDINVVEWEKYGECECCGTKRLYI